MRDTFNLISWYNLYDEVEASNFSPPYTVGSRTKGYRTNERGKRRIQVQYHEHCTKRHIAPAAAYYLHPFLLSPF